MKKIYCLGPKGTYGHEAAQKINEEYFHANAEISFCRSHEEILKQLAHKSSDSVGVVAMRNSIAGLVIEVAKFWLNKPTAPLQVIGNVDLLVNHQLVARPGLSLSGVCGVYSHHQALIQCEKTLDELKIKDRRAVSSTACAAKIIGNNPAGKMAAISSRFCAELYQLATLKTDIQDVYYNTTRFHIITNGPVNTEGDLRNKKMAAIFVLKDEKGALHKVTGKILEAEMNIEFIVSIQNKTMNNIAFYIEMDMPQEVEGQKMVLRSLSNVTERITCLGIFPAV